MKGISVDGMTSREQFSKRLRASEYLKTPPGWAFLFVAALMLSILGFGARTMSLFDQDTYVEYFRLTTWDWLAQFYHDRASTSNFVISLVTEELGWRIWVICVNLTGMTPEGGIRLTVLLLNSLVIYSLAHLRRPLLGLILWLVIPNALATVGLFQIRQGFAFAVAMLFVTRFRRPILGMVVASMVHTTFAVPAILLVAIRLCRNRKWLGLLVAGVTALILASTAQYLFQTFGGRRVEEYSGYQDDFTIRLVMLLLFYMMASVTVLYSSWRAPNTNRQIALVQLSIMHIGLVIYLIAAFFIYPLGKGRVWYCVPLLLPFLVPEIRFKNVLVVWTTLGVLAVVSADVAKSYFEGVYSYFLG